MWIQNKKYVLKWYLVGEKRNKYLNFLKESISYLILFIQTKFITILHYGTLGFYNFEFFNYINYLLNSVRGKYYYRDYELFFYYIILILHIIMFGVGCYFFYYANFYTDEFCYEFYYNFYKVSLSNGHNYEFVWHIGFDGITFCFVLLTIFLIIICFIVSIDSISNNIFLYCYMFLLLEICLIMSFISLDIFFFYIFFEIILIPMFFLILIWGSRVRKKLSANLFFLYTALGSFLILIGIIMLIVETGSTDITVLWDIKLPLVKQYFIWFFFFFGFCIKVPMFPVHLWLPEAHVEAPTAGSIILAGILLKLGGYGFLRFLLPVCSDAHEIFVPIVYMMALLSIFYASFVIIRQTDMKKIIAYSSIIHMNVGILGLFSLTFEGIQGSLLLMVGHGFISSGLFLLVGTLYERYGTRVIYHYGGLVYRMPIFVIFFFFFTLSNTSFPGTVNFVGEFLTFFGIFEYSVVSFLFSSFFVMFFGAFYSFWLFNRVSFGELNELHFCFFYDLNFKEIFSLFLLSTCILFFGVYSSVFFSFINSGVINIMFRLL